RRNTRAVASSLSPKNRQPANQHNDKIRVKRAASNRARMERALVVVLAVETADVCWGALACAMKDCGAAPAIRGDSVGSSEPVAAPELCGTGATVASAWR